MGAGCDIDLLSPSLHCFDELFKASGYTLEAVQGLLPQPLLQRDDARGHFRQIRRADYEAARSIWCWTSCSPFQIVGREPPDLGLILRPFGSIQATAAQLLPTVSPGHTDKALLGRPEPIPKKHGACIRPSGLKGEWTEGADHTAVACPKRCGRPVWRSTPAGIGSWRRRENSVRFVGSRLREKARALVSGQFRVTDVLLPRREQSLKFRFRVCEKLPMSTWTRSMLRSSSGMIRSCAVSP